MVRADERIVHLVLLPCSRPALGAVGGLEEEVLVHLARDVELCRAQAAVAGAHDMALEDAGREDALARVGEDEVVVEAQREREAVSAQLVAPLVQVARQGEGVTRALETLVEYGHHALQGTYQGTLLVWLRGPEFSSSVWRTRLTELVSDLRLSSRCARTVSAYSSAL